MDKPTCTIRCMGCGKDATGEFSQHSQAWHKPRYWYQRSDKDGVQVACSERCIDTVAKASGKSAVKLPI